MTTEEVIKEVLNMKKFNYTLAPDEVFDRILKTLRREKAWEEDNAFREKKWGKGGDDK